ncbi:MAG: sigma-70 family RNA polymerase sigma factor [Flavobacteriales bacterium]|nr:sigma-70 family RNA polymerase sigma factor [Flavobacteriales bacterium]
MGKHIDIHAGLIERCQRNEARAQAEIYRLYSKAMYNVSLRIVGNREDAEDVLQESFVSAFRSIDLFRAESSFGSWLKRIVINRSLNQIRGKIYFTEVKDEIMGFFDSAEEEEQDEIEYSVKDIKNVLTQLSDGYRAVFTLYMFEDHSHKEIAELLKITESTSKSQLNRAKKKVREHLIQLKNERRQA